MTNMQEWQTIYDQMKMEIAHLNSENNMIKSENAKLVKIKGTKSDKDVLTKLRKRELECQALWDTIKEMYGGGAGFTKEEMMKLLSLRALDCKAERKVFT